MQQIYVACRLCVDISSYMILLYLKVDATMSCNAAVCQWDEYESPRHPHVWVLQHKTERLLAASAIYLMCLGCMSSLRYRIQCRSPAIYPLHWGPLHHFQQNSSQILERQQSYLTTAAGYSVCSANERTRDLGNVTFAYHGICLISLSSHSQRIPPS